jgi:hypothetical protein
LSGLFEPTANDYLAEATIIDVRYIYVAYWSLLRSSARPTVKARDDNQLVAILGHLPRVTKVKQG